MSIALLSLNKYTHPIFPSWITFYGNMLKFPPLVVDNVRVDVDVVEVLAVVVDDSPWLSIMLGLMWMW